MYVSVFGVDAITYDEATSLEWLDVTASVDRSYDDMAGNDGSNEFLPGSETRFIRGCQFEEMRR
ncbi:MAG: hypothetical protein MI806_12555 [Minwuiales bacterium]|nr:hypothetical protein [Minwuiales bacterium]